MSTIEIIVDECEHYENVKITIQCKRVDKDLSQLIEQIQQFDISFHGKKEDKIYAVKAQDLLYAESVDSKTFLYSKKHIYESNLKLYEIEKAAESASFIRISKNLVVNTAQIESVRALFNGRFEATLKNGEKVVVNRRYVKAFKMIFLK